MTSRLLFLFLMIINLSCSSTADTPYSNYGLKAEDFFADRGVIKLCQAIEANNLEEIRRLVKGEGVDVNAKGKHDITPLQWSMLNDEIEQFELLLDLGADPNIVLTGDVGTPPVFKKGNAVVHLASGAHAPNYISLVMSHGGDYALLDSAEEMAMHRVLRGYGSNMKERVQLLIDHGADPNSYSFETGFTPLALAISKARYEVVLLLLENGADYEFYYENGRTNALMGVLIQAEQYKKDLASKEYIKVDTEDFDQVVDWLKGHGADFDRAQEELRAWRKESYHLEQYTEEYYRAKKLEDRVKEEAAKRYEELKKKHGKI